MVPGPRPSFRVAVAPGAANRSVDVAFFSDVAGAFYGDTAPGGLGPSAFSIVAVLLAAGGDAATAPGAAFLADAEGLAATQVLEWMWVGPFGDDHFTARDRALGPEAGPVDYNETWRDGGRTLAWEKLPAPPAGPRAAPALLPMPPAAAAFARNRTVAAVLCAHVYVDAGGAGPVVAALSGTTSALAEVTLDGAPVLTDRLITGSQLREFGANVTLSRGAWHVLRVKAMQLSWASPWEFALSLHQPGSVAPVPGLRTTY